MRSSDDTSEAALPLSISEELLNRCKIAKVFGQGGRVNHLDFWPRTGEYLVASADDDALTIYDTDKATVQKTVLFRETGVQLAHFSHHQNALLCAANKGSNGDVMYHNIVDNRILRRFQGHSDRVTSLSLNPENDSFASGSADGSIRLWDLRTKQCSALLLAAGRPCVQYGPQGLVFAAISDSGSVRLFDARGYQKGPFSSFGLSHGQRAEWTNVEFSPDGKHLLLSAATNLIVLMDAFTGEEEHTFTSHVNTHCLELGASFSPDGKFLASSSEEGHIHVWEAASAREVAVLKGGHAKPVAAVRWHPTRFMIASACSHVDFWIPDMRT